MAVHYRYATVGGHRLFYREAAAGPGAPTVVLLHGCPASSFMFRDLIPLLGPGYRVIAPDLLGSGLSDAPSPDRFEYEFAGLANLTRCLLDQLGVGCFALYLHDCGAPVGWRIALDAPQRITAIISQAANAFEVGFGVEHWQPIWDYGLEPSAETEAALRRSYTLDAIRWQYQHGVVDETLVSPDTWQHDWALLARPGRLEVQLRLARDHLTNLALFPRLHRYLRQSQVPVLALWGRHDQILVPAGAEAFGAVAPGAQVHLLDGGHYLLESQLAEMSALILPFLAATHGAGG
jgi:pimeloyl-ACP methyl ester carboxylesterase